MGGVAYGEIPQCDHDHDDRNDGPSPSASLSPAPSLSSMPFLSTIESTFTPLSMHSDSYSGTGSKDSAVVDSRDTHGKVGGTATAKAGASIGTMVQSLSSARATNPAKRNHHNEYGLLSPDDAPSSVSSSPNLDNNADPSPDLNSKVQRDFAPESSVAQHDDHKSSRAASSTSAKESSTYGLSPQRSHDLHQPTIVKPKPIVRTASTKSVSLRHPAPDLLTRTSSYASNIAQLEATAEKLSMTSSIEDAIRDLHEEQKRNDSRRSSILAASIGSIPEHSEPVNFPTARSTPAASSILETNAAARYGGYSPAGHFMSPNPSLLSTPSRLRSTSGGVTRSEPEIDNLLSRHGPGQSSVRSVRSASKPTLTDIAELEPTTLTSAAMDEADRLAEEPERDETLRMPQIDDIDLTPNAENYGMPNPQDYWDHPVANARYNRHEDEDRPLTSAGSTCTYEQAERAFADFDGAHCSPDADLEESAFLPLDFGHSSMESPFLPLNSVPPINEHELDQSRPLTSRPNHSPTVRPHSYLDPETGETMLYYPARVPAMLNVPQKLSKKPKAEVRNARRSQALSSMPEANRQSRATWLPEYLPEPLFDPLGSTSDLSTPMPRAGPEAQSELPAAPDALHESQSQSQPNPRPTDDESRKSRSSIPDSSKRQSKLPALDGLPPQLRASAFFDLPSEPPKIELKNGSAMATLDSILDASAKAPVSAFTDHTFAGSLGSEVYGVDKKRKSHMKHASTTSLEPKKRSSFMHLRMPSALSRHSKSQEGHQDTTLGDTTVEYDDKQDEERRRLSGSINGEAVPDGDEDEDEEPLPYNGPPTTLLAELQIRKQQQKLRTRPISSAFPDGMRSTLLEMDTVAEIERKTRKDKKVNLAWEEPDTATGDESDDEDMPLGLLMAARGQGNNLTAAIDEINRPLGLMERRDMEDNEPLSRRRERLQGKEVGPMKRPSTMILGQDLRMTGALGPPSPQHRTITPEDDEIEGETLGERMRRLRAREDAGSLLPRARPVSSAFSTELLSHLGDTFKGEESDDKSKDQRISPPNEEETLGQRRRRLQAEREAGEHGMAELKSPGGIAGNAPKLTKRHSLADVLATRGARTVLSDPRADAERAKQQEAARYRQDQEQKMTTLRNQMPSHISTPNLNRSGGYLSGRFNDGTGGGFGNSRASIALNGYGGQSTGANVGMMSGGMINGGITNKVYSMGGIPNRYSAQMANVYGMPSPMQAPGQIDKVERWRQSIQP
ncbi:hypothetical protein F4779DRAFT_620629 [Xylariaceae sp. FL0662B]|nr:hypothetical protein F4779DRAFT_620629 [Xylariaceae sp. FL0662B]